MPPFRLIAICALGFAGATASHAQAPTPEGHPAYALAQTIAAAGCQLTGENTNLILFEAGLQPPEFPPLAIALIEDGYLVPAEGNAMTLVNWGACVGNIPPETGGGTEEDDG